MSASAWRARAALRLYNNSVFAENYENAIEYRFPRTQGVAIINNLTNAQINSRNGGSGRVETNVTVAQGLLVHG